jgi:hypothetical protein
VESCEGFRRVGGVGGVGGWVGRVMQGVVGEMCGLYAGESRLHRLDRPDWMFEHLHRFLRINKKSA